MQVNDTLTCIAYCLLNPLLLFWAHRQSLGGLSKKLSDLGKESNRAKILLQ